MLYKNIHNFFSSTSIVRFIIIAVLIVLTKDYIVNTLLVDNKAGTEDIESLKENLPFFFFLVVIIGPIIETITYQAIPIVIVQFLMRRVLFNNALLPILVSALVFGFSHLYNLTYFINAFLSGILYAWFYIIVQNRRESAVIVVFAIHSFKNLFVFILEFM